MQKKTVDRDSHLGNVNKNNSLVWVTRFVDGRAIVKFNICIFVVDDSNVLFRYQVKC